MNNHSSNSKPTKVHCSTTEPWETNADDLATNEQPLNQSKANQEPLLYHWDKRNQLRWLDYQWTTTQPIQSQLRSTALPLGRDKPMQMTWLPMNKHSTNPKPTKNHYYTTGTRENNADDLTTNEQPLNQLKAN